MDICEIFLEKCTLACGMLYFVLCDFALINIKRLTVEGNIWVEFFEEINTFILRKCIHFTKSCGKGIHNVTKYFFANIGINYILK